jgi:SAM-dependent methyltransferase
MFLRGWSIQIAETHPLLTMHDYDDTIDWHQFWSEADDEDRDSATPSSHHLLGVLSEFIAETGVPDSFADVGCGPALIALDVAERYPETTVVGYDAAESILTENRQCAEENSRENIRFEQAMLPAFDPDRQFDLVLCYATLDYIAESERALQNLYDAVAPDGHLVFNYPNRFARTHRREVVNSPESYGDRDDDFDRERFAERFQLVLGGKNLLSYERIHDALGTWPQSFWSVVERPDKRWAWHHFPLVYVPK